MTAKAAMMSEGNSSNNDSSNDNDGSSDGKSSNGECGVVATMMVAMMAKAEYTSVGNYYDSNNNIISSGLQIPLLNLPILKHSISLSVIV